MTRTSNIAGNSAKACRICHALEKKHVTMSIEVQKKQIDTAGKELFQAKVENY